MNPIPATCPRCAAPLPAGALGSCPRCAAQDASSNDGSTFETVAEGVDLGTDVICVADEVADAGILSAVVDGLGTVGGAAVDVIGAIGSGIGGVAGAILDGLGEGLDF